MSWAERLAPYAAAVVAILGAGVLVIDAQPPARGFDAGRFAALPVLEGGRIKPIDTLARNSLLLLSGRQTVDAGDREESAIEWLLDLLYAPDKAVRQPVITVDDPDVLGLLGKQQTSERRLSYADIEPGIDALRTQASEALAIDSKRRTRFQSAVVSLWERIRLFHQLGNTLHLWEAGPLADEIAKRGAAGADQRAGMLAEGAAFRVLPPRAGDPADTWRSAGESLIASKSAPFDPRLTELARLETAYASNAPWDFNAALEELQGGTALDHPELVRSARSEVVFNRAAPFYSGMVIYLVALLCVFLFWLSGASVFASAAYGFVGAGALVHTTGLVARIVLQGRPPVTNLYSSAVFVGWIVVLLGLFIERLYRKTFATAVAAGVGFTTLLIAHHLMSDGDTMEMMRAVLDSNFWLATHVVAITIGYSGTFLAGTLAIVYALRKHLAPGADPEVTRALTSMVYGTVCFSVLFSFVGTVLGGIWADQSWGRFWGWDPKENGALLIVLWNAIILHARMGGYARERGMMAMAIGGNIVTSLSWFGVNMLGIGLHSYGFMEKAFWSLTAFIAVQILLIGVCLLPPLRLTRREEARVPLPSAE